MFVSGSGLRLITYHRSAKYLARPSTIVLGRYDTYSRDRKHGSLS